MENQGNEKIDPQETREIIKKEFDDLVSKVEPITKEELGGDYYQNKKQYARDILSGENEDFEDDYDKKTTFLENNPVLREKIMLYGKDNLRFVMRLRAVRHFFPNRLIYLLHDFESASIFNQAFSGKIYNPDHLKPILERIGAMPDEEVKRESEMAEALRRIVEQPLRAEEKDTLVRQYKKGAKKDIGETKKHVESDALQGSIQWHMDRREQGIKGEDAEY